MLGLGRILFQLLPQAADMDVHRPDVAAVLVGPDGVQQRLPGVDPAGVAHQEFHHIKLLGGEHDQLLSLVGVPGIQVQGDVACRQAVAGLLFLRGACPAQERPDPGLQLQDIEGLGQVVIGAVVEADELVHVLHLGGEEDDGHIGKLPDLAAGGEPVHNGHHHVQNDQVRLLFLGHLHSLLAVGAGDHIVAFAF